MYQSDFYRKIIHGYHILFFLLYVDILYCTIIKIQWMISFDEYVTAIVLLCYILPVPLYFILKRTMLYKKSRRWRNIIEEIQTFQLIIASVSFFELNQFAFANMIPSKSRVIFVAVVLFGALFYGNYYHRKCLNRHEDFAEKEQ